MAYIIFQSIFQALPLLNVDIVACEPIHNSHTHTSRNNTHDQYSSILKMMTMMMMMMMMTMAVYRCVSQCLRYETQPIIGARSMLLFGIPLPSSFSSIQYPKSFLSISLFHPSISPSISSLNISSLN